MYGKQSLMTHPCLICNADFSNIRKLSKHIRDTHCSIKEYVDKHLLISKPKCLYCSKEPEFVGLNGYKKTCKNHFSKLRSDSAKEFRKNLKKDNEKFHCFVEKVKKNQTEIWKTRPREILTEISTKISKTIKNANNLLSDKERLKKYSRYYKCNEQKIKQLNEQGAKHLLQLTHKQKTGYSHCRSGRFVPRYPKKYIGNPTQIYYRSGLELRCMLLFDSHPDVLSWSSEEIVIPYYSEVDKRMRRYFPDFFIEKKARNGRIIKEIIEVKPKKQTMKPKKRRNQSNESFLAEAKTYSINTSKWEAAKKFCEQRKISFRIMTEDDILGIPLSIKGLKTTVKSKSKK